MMDTIDCFVKNLEELLKEEGLTYEGMGRAVGVSPVTMRNWSSNRSYPSVKSLAKIATYFDISVDYLLGLTQDMEWRPAARPVPFIERYDMLLKQSRLRDINIANLLKTRTSTIAGWRGGKVPVLPTLIKLCEIFDCSFGYLTGISDR